MTLKMHFETPEESQKAWENFQEERHLWKEAEKSAQNIVELNVKQAWLMALDILSPEDEISEAEALQQMITLLVTRGDFSVWKSHRDEDFFVVRFGSREFRCPQWKWGVAKAFFWSEQELKVKAKIYELRGTNAQIS